MHKDDFVKTGKSQIRFPGKIRVMKAEAVAEPVDKSSYDDLRLGISAANARHAPVPLFGGKNIHHEAKARLLRTVVMKPPMLNICMPGTAG